MKRALTLALTVAVIGGLTFMGIAGTAAAQEAVNQSDFDADAETSVSVDQSNSNSQNQFASSYSSSSTSHSATVAEQGQNVNQVNDNEVEDTTSVATNTGVEGDVNVDDGADDGDVNETDGADDGDVNETDGDVVTEDELDTALDDLIGEIDGIVGEDLTPILE